MKNLAFIYQEHYLTNCARVACNKQRGVNNNFVIIECGYSNGLYSWKPGKESTYDVYDNNGCMCWCVPMSDLTKVKELKDIPEKEIKDQIKKD